jgi:hypothetical protein
MSNCSVKLAEMITWKCAAHVIFGTPIHWPADELNHSARYESARVKPGI